MHDSDPPKCPRCNDWRDMRKKGEAIRAGARKDDVDAVAKIFYRCSRCRVRWVDNMDGTELSMMGEAKQKN